MDDYPSGFAGWGSYAEKGEGSHLKQVGEKDETIHDIETSQVHYNIFNFVNLLGLPVRYRRSSSSDSFLLGGPGPAGSIRGSDHVQMEDFGYEDFVDLKGTYWRSKTTATC